MTTHSATSYSISKTAQWLHELAHLNGKLRRISNSTFDEHNKEYVESLVVFAAIPVLIVIAVLLVFLVYSIFVCLCGTSVRNGKRVDHKACKVFIFFFAILCGLAFIVGTVATFRIHSGVKEVRNSTEDAAKVFDSIKVSTRELAVSANVTVDIATIRVNLRDAGLQDNTLDDTLAKMQDMDHKVSDNLRVIYDQMDGVDVNSVPKDMKKYEDYRWGVTFAVLAVLALLGVAFTCAICCRCALICFSVLAVIAFIICALLVSVTLVLGVSGSDFCYDAKPYIKSKMDGMVKRAVADYYVDCPLNDAINPFEGELATASLTLYGMNDTVRGFRKVFDELCPSPLFRDCTPDIKARVLSALDSISRKTGDAYREMDNVRRLVDCRRVNDDFNAGLSAVCTDVVDGVAMLWANMIVAAFAFAVIIFCATYTAR